MYNDLINSVLSLLRQSCLYEIRIIYLLFLDSSMVEHSAVNRRVVGSSPTRGVICIIRPRGQEVKTSPFHGGNTGSIPVGVTHLNLISLLRRISSVG